MLHPRMNVVVFPLTEFIAVVRTSSLVCFFWLTASASTVNGQAGKIEYGRDIGPILSDTCFKCHGPDEHDRQADLRLDTRTGLFDDSSAVVANDLEASQLYQRIISDDPDLLMPPPDSGRELTATQKNMFKRWIEEGAVWEKHWSLIPPEKPAVPNSNLGVTNPIDSFIRQRLNEAGLSPSREADRRVLIRRVAFDLTGLPPSSDLLAKHVNSEEPKWYEGLVDELLASPHYGEHMARYWLDAARYGDTHGLHLDNYREMWPYRDWVVSAFNQNMSYRDFTIEQLAGDLLDDPTDQQLIASGFNRAHITTNEGGAIMEEVYVRNVVDRVATTGTVFMGMTIGCAQCHDHKFDPISRKEFYQLFAFFNNLSDAPMDKNIKNPAPVIKVMSESQKSKLALLQQQAEAAITRLDERVAGYEYIDPMDKKTEADSSEAHVSQTKNSEPAEFVWLEDDAFPTGAKPEQNWNFVSKSDGPVNSGLKSRVAVGKSGMVQHFFTGAAPIKAMKGDQLFAYVFLDPEDTPSEIMLQFNDGNWEHRVYWGANKIDWGTDNSPSRFYGGELPEAGKWVRLEVDAEKVGFLDLTLINGMAFTQWGGKAHWDSAGIVSKTDQSFEFKSLAKWVAMARQTKGKSLPNSIKTFVNQAEDKIGEDGRKKLRDYFLINVHPEARKEFADLLNQRDQIKKSLEEFKNKLPTTLISRENAEVKQAFMLDRGEYDKKGQPVDRDTPAAFPKFGDDLPRDRLGFAKWLTAEKHPLTARVAVNRFWQQVFGTGIVKTSEDFGFQGDPPSHPELLDWLATDFVENNWDVRRLMKMIVMSSTYRQTSFISQEALSADPQNRLLARGPRFRLDAEMLRDQALSISGLLDTKIGGPGVKPPQPDGLWFAVGYSGSNTVRFKKDTGRDKVHRRSLYTFWKRTAPPPQMTTFDAPSREECRVRRERTNTPMQALLLMNDPQYVEAARHLAESTMDWAGHQPHQGNFDSDSVWQSAEFMFIQALGMPATNRELELIQATFLKNLDEFQADRAAASRLISIGESPADPKKYDPCELAAWTMIGNLIMNMDEFLSKN